LGRSLKTKDIRLKKIEEKVDKGERLTEEDALYLLSDKVPLGKAGELAYRMRERLYGKKAYFVRNFHLNLTNICQSNCRFCSFKKKAGEEGAYALSPNDALDLASEAVRKGVTEIHVVNALNPYLPFDYYLKIVSSLKASFPSVTLKAFTAVEVDFFSKLTGFTYKEVLKKLKNVGVNYLPGGGAEIFDSSIRRKLGTSKIPGSIWLKIHETAHKLKIPTNATMLYGHFEKNSHIVKHLSRLRKLQDKTQGFKTFIPLKFIPFNTEIKIRESSAPKDLKVIAVSRLFLDNFPHIKAYWVSLTPEVAQVALSFGADDIDGTIFREKIIHAAGIKVEEGMTPEELSFLISDAGFIPIERNSFYAEARRSEPNC